MCGIAGLLGEFKDRRTHLSRMLNALVHRGPDEKGEYIDKLFAGGMRRLSINDLQGGSQPLFNHDKSIVLLYNGEIYNSGELRRELEATGKRFRTRSDGEVIAHLYEDLGESAFERLDGMFAVALWDSRREHLLLARDLPGEKPLYFARLNQGQLVFASEVKALERLGIVHRNVATLLNELQRFKILPHAWMNDPERTSLISRFSREFAWTSDDWPEHWRRYLDGLSNS